MYYNIHNNTIPQYHNIHNIYNIDASNSYPTRATLYCLKPPYYISTITTITKKSQYHNIHNTTILKYPHYHNTTILQYPQYHNIDGSSSYPTCSTLYCLKPPYYISTITTITKNHNITISIIPQY